jgi:hypothetical protein
MTGPTAATKTDGAAVRNGGSSAKLDGGETVIWDVTSAGADIIIPADEDEDEG